MVKNGKGGDENLKKFFLVWLKLKIETKMRKGKYVSKIKTDHLGKDLCSRITIP
jgi:hypothetical protein